MASHLAFLPSLRMSRRKLGFMLTVLLLTLLAHLAVIEWLKSELRMMPLLDDDDEEQVISIALQPEREPPALPKPKDLPPPKAAELSEPIAAVPVTAVPAAVEPSPPAASEPPADNPVPAESDALAARPETSGEADAGAHSTAPTSSAPALFARASPPPSAELKYAVVGMRNGSRTTGSGKIVWRHDGQRYSVAGEVGVLLFTLLSYKSVGEVSEIGLVPAIYAEKRIGRSQTNTHFHRERNSISFSASTDVYPVRGGEQDRSTWIWQIASLGRGDPEKFEAGLLFEMSVAGHKSLDPWRVYVNGRENIELPQGTVSTWRLSVIPGENSFERQFDLWLAPDRDWYPVMLKHVDKNGNSVDMMLTEVGAAP